MSLKYLAGQKAVFLLFQNKRRFLLLPVIAAGSVLLLCIFIRAGMALLPFPQLDAFLKRPCSTRIYDRNGELLQVVVTAIVNVEINVALDAGQAPTVCVLPEIPLALILHRVYIIMRNPIWIGVEDGVAKVGRLEFIICINYRFDAVMCLDKAQPSQHALLKLLRRLRLGLALHVEHRRQVALFKLHGAQEMLRLRPPTRRGAPEVVSPAHKAILARLMEIFTEATVYVAGPLGGLYHDKAHGVAAYHAVVAKHGPVDGPLVVAHVDAVDFIALGIGCVAIQCPPPETKRAYKEIIESPHIQPHNQAATKQPRPAWQLAEHPQIRRMETGAARLPAGRGPAGALPLFGMLG